MLDFTTFSIVDWITFSLLVLAIVIWVCLMFLNFLIERKRDQMFQNLEQSIDRGLRQLEAGVDRLEKSNAFSLGFAMGKCWSLDEDEDDEE